MRETLHFQEQRHPSIKLEMALNFHSFCTWKQLVLKATLVYTVLFQFKQGLRLLVRCVYRNMVLIKACIDPSPKDKFISEDKLISHRHRKLVFLLRQFQPWERCSVSFIRVQYSIPYSSVLYGINQIHCILKLFGIVNFKK